MSTLKDKAQSILNEKDAKIKSENIKRGIQIFDIVGTLDQDISKFDNNYESQMGNNIITSLLVAPEMTLDTSTNLSNMFSNASKLVSVPNYKTSNVTAMSAMFFGCSSLVNAPELDTHNVTDFSSMFAGCSVLENVPVYDMTSATLLLGMFKDCNALSHQSLLNILQSCISATSYTNTKGLNILGISEDLRATLSEEELTKFKVAGWELVKHSYYSERDESEIHFGQYDEEDGTVGIDVINNSENNVKVVINASTYGFSHTIDQLNVGETISIPTGVNTKSGYGLLSSAEIEVTTL